MKSFRQGIGCRFWILCTCLIIVLQFGQCSEENCIKDIKDAGISADCPVQGVDRNAGNDAFGYERYKNVELVLTEIDFRSQAPNSPMKNDEPLIHLEIGTATFIKEFIYMMNYMMVLLLLRMLVLSSNKKCVNKAEKIKIREEGEILVHCSENDTIRRKPLEYLNEDEFSHTEFDACKGHCDDEKKSYDLLNDRTNSQIISLETTYGSLQKTAMEINSCDQYRDSRADKKNFDEVELMEHSENKIVMNESNTGKYCTLEVDSRQEQCQLHFQLLDFDVEEDTEDDEETFLKFTPEKVRTCNWIDFNHFSTPVSKPEDMIRHTQYTEGRGTQRSGYDRQFEMTTNDSIDKIRGKCNPGPVQCTDRCAEGYMISMKKSMLERVFYFDYLSGKGQSQVIPESLNVVPERSNVSFTVPSTCCNVAEAEICNKEPIQKSHIVCDEARVGNCTPHVCKEVRSTNGTDVLITFLKDNVDDTSTEASFHSHKKNNSQVCDEPVDSFGDSFMCISQRQFHSKCHQSFSVYEESRNGNDTSFQTEASDLETDYSCSIPIGSSCHSSEYFPMEDNCPYEPGLSFFCDRQNTEKRWCSAVDDTQDDDKSKKTKRKESTRIKSVLYGSSLRWYCMQNLQSLTPRSEQQSKKKKRKQYHTSLLRYNKKTVKNFFKKYNKKNLRNIVTWQGSFQRNARYLNTVTTFPTSGRISGGQLSGVVSNEEGNQPPHAYGATAAANVILPTNGDDLGESVGDSNLSEDRSSSIELSLNSYFSSVINGSLSSIDEEMKFEWKRLQSFGNFPLTCPVSPLHLARDGWYCGNDGDSVICFSCQATHRGWTYGSNTRSFHHPTCSFMLGYSANVPIHMNTSNTYLPRGQMVSNPMTPPVSSSESFGSGGRTDWALLGNGTDRQQTSVRQPEMLSRDRGHPVIAQTSSAGEDLLQQQPQDQHYQQQNGFATGRSHFTESTGVQQQQGAVQQQPQTGQQQDTASQQQNMAIHQNTAIQQQTSRPTDTDSRNRAQSAIFQGRAINATTMSAGPSPGPQPNVNPSPLGISFEKPRYPAYAVLASRISTFEEWAAKGFSQTPRSMASAGFYYAGYGDYVRCFFCGGGLRNWVTGDDPWVEHARWYPNCTFVRQNKGDRFVEEMLQKARERDPNSDLARERQTSNTPDSSKNEMDSAAVLSIKEMGYTSDQIKKALNEMKKRLGAGRHTVTAQDILEVIFEIAERERTEDENSAVKQRQSSNSSPSAVASQPASRSKTEKKSSIPKTDKTGKKSSLEKKENSIGDKGGKKTSLERKENSKENPAEDKTESGSSGLTEEELRSLKEENTHLKEQIMCKICMDNNVSVAFLPCGHLACCRECAPAMRKCPICRQAVKGVVKTFLA